MTKEKMAKYHNSVEEITALIKAQVPIIWVLTHEENRFIEDFYSNIATPLSRDTWLWSAYQGLVKLEQSDTIDRAGGEEKDTWKPPVALTRIGSINKSNNSRGTCFIMRDFHIVLTEPVPRQLRDMFRYLTDENKTLVITSPILAHGPGGTKSGLPPTLEKQISVVRYELPNHTQIYDRIDGILQHMQEAAAEAPAKKKVNSKIDYTHDEINSFAKACQGLTLLEVDQAICTSMSHMRRVDTEKLLNDKRQIIRKSEILEFIDTPVGMNDVGGLDQAKIYLQRYAEAYSDEAVAFGVEPLRGLLLTGIPGTGKSLLAKAIGRLWQVPLLRLDVGKVMTGLVGGSEGKMRDVINQAEAMAPTVLWLDEVEKSLSGTKSSNFSDGGTLARVFGTLLTAMQDGMEGVTLVATANDITMLPPEFIRRFNEVFFVDLPGPDERWEILNIHLSKRGRDVNNFMSEQEAILKASDGYTGAEIEKAIKDSIASAFYAGDKDVTAKHIVTALANTKPISKVMADKVKKLRDKARGQYRYASSYAEENAQTNKVKTSTGKTLDMDDALQDMPELIKTKKEKSTKARASTKRFSNLV